jgi:hypothetical protein
MNFEEELAAMAARREARLMPKLIKDDILIPDSKQWRPLAVVPEIP